MPRGHVLPDGAKVAALRGEADLTQWQLAAETGYGLRTIGKIESSKPTGARTLAAAAIVLSRRLKRPIQLGDLIRRANGDAIGATMADSGLVEEGMKFLDLSGWRPRGSNGNGCCSDDRALLFDHYRFRRLPATTPVLSFHYATTGKGIEGRCISHADAQWREMSEQPTTTNGEIHLKRRFQMRFDLEKLAAADSPIIENRLEYFGAFSGSDKEWFHTHVAFPTECLTIVALYPPAKPCRTARGVCRQHPAGPFLRSPEEPVRTPDGKMVIWRLRKPELGATYQLEWDW
ncbi:MAG: helix-turn-helix domain-containing protein [Gemmataceae bacterium]|nr:helix-turn-helix domain-containing protein [Gemmataceae bacterium]